MHTFFTPHTTAFLSESESHHATKVMRLKAGNTIRLVDGKGNGYLAEIAEIHQKKTLLNVIETLPTDVKPAPLHIAIAPTKTNERFEFFIEKAIELGISEITPIFSFNSERKKLNVERVNRIAIAALKQSMRAFMPTINEPIKYADFIKQQNDNEKFICFCGDSEKVDLKTIDFAKPTTILIGPEGDFNEKEVELALEKGFKILNLGKARLRTETAAIFSLSLLNQ